MPVQIWKHFLLLCTYVLSLGFFYLGIATRISVSKNEGIHFRIVARLKFVGKDMPWGNHRYAQATANLYISYRFYASAIDSLEFSFFSQAIGRELCTCVIQIALATYTYVYALLCKILRKELLFLPISPSILSVKHKKTNSWSAISVAIAEWKKFQAIHLF